MPISGRTLNVVTQSFGDPNTAQALVNLLDTGTHGTVSDSIQIGFANMLCNPVAAAEVVAAIANGGATLSGTARIALREGLCDPDARSELIAAIQALT